MWDGPTKFFLECRKLYIFKARQGRARLNQQRFIFLSTRGQHNNHSGTEIPQVLQPFDLNRGLFVCCCCFLSMSFSLLEIKYARDQICKKL